MSVIAIPRVLQERLSAEGAEALVEIINKADERTKENVIELVEERFEKRLAQAETRLIRWMFIFWIGQMGAFLAFLHK
jgi:flagellar motor switch protein FliG